MGVTVWSLKRGTMDRYSHSQAHHRLPTTTQLSTMGIPFEEVRPKYSHDVVHVNDEQSSLGHEPADPIISFTASLLDEWSL